MKAQEGGGDYNMILRIFDASNYIWAGAFSKRVISRGVREDNGEYIANQAPISGVRFLITQIANLVDENTVIMPVFDRTPTVKREMYNEAFNDPYGYKGKRATKPFDITFQKDYAEEILRECGFPVQAIEGYEADDVIYTLVETYKYDFEHIYVHTRDSDMSFMVAENVSIAKVGDKGKVINMYNYNTMADLKGCRYNISHLLKLCRGDVSDNIPGVGWRWGELLDSVLPQEEYQKLGDLDLCRKWIRKVVMENPLEPGGHNVLRTFNIVCPLQAPVDELDDSEMDVDLGKLNYFKNDWNEAIDEWGLEDQLLEYINQYYE